MYIEFNSKTIAFTISDCCCQVNIQLFFLMNHSDADSSRIYLFMAV